MSTRTVAVSYQNTLPLREGIARLHRSGLIDLELDKPNRATQRFARGEFVLGLLPVAAQFAVPEALPFGRYGIVSDGFVGSVGIFSERPLHELSAVTSTTTPGAASTSAHPPPTFALPRPKPQPALANPDEAPRHPHHHVP